MKPQLTILAAGLAAALEAAVPMAWTNSPGMTPRVLPPVPHGSAIDFAVTLKGYSSPPVADGADLRLWFQTNGMDDAWWSAPATLRGDTITASFGPAEDTGADRVSLFFGAPSNAFAAAVLRLSHAPGFLPNALPLPVERLDFDAIEIANAPWPDEIAAAADATLAAANTYTDAATNALSVRVAADETAIASHTSQLSQLSQSLDGKAAKSWVESNFVGALDFADFRTAINGTVANALEAAKDYADGLLDRIAVEATAARVASNTVETVLAPRAIEYHYGDVTQDQAFILPNWATSAWQFVRDGESGEPGDCGTARIVSNGLLRNYSLVVEEIPDDVAERTIALTFQALRATHRIYATPEFHDIEDPRVPDAWGWLLTTNDVPCVVTVREPQAGLLIVRRDRLGGEEATGYITIEDGRPVIWGRR